MREKNTEYINIERLYLLNKIHLIHNEIAFLFFFWLLFLESNPVNLVFTDVTFGWRLTGW